MYATSWFILKQSAIAPLCLLCTGTSSCYSLHPQKMYAWAKFISIPSPVRTTSQPLSTLSLWVLTDEILSSLAAPRPQTSLIHSRSFQNGIVSRDLDRVVKFIGVRAATVRGAGCISGLGLGLYLEAVSLVMPQTLLWSSSSSLMRSRALPSWRPRGSCLIWPFSFSLL